MIALFAPLQFLVDILQPILQWLHDSVGLGWGMSIVGLTVLVRAALVPLTVKQYKSMRALQQAAPELKKLQAKYKDDKQRQQQEVMKFYQENRINPFASCLPLLLQLPFFLGLFYLLQDDLRNDICGQTAVACGELATSDGAEQFFFIPDLTDNATGGVLAALIVLYIGSQLLASILMSATADRNQRLIIFGLPFVFTVFIINFPAGLIVYWITTNLWTVGQQYILRKLAAKKEAEAEHATGREGPAEEPKAAKSGGLFGGLLAKVNDAQAANGRAGGTANGAASGATTTTGTKSRAKGAKPAAVAAGSAKPRSSGGPPPSARKKKKRSGRRR